MSVGPLAHYVRLLSDAITRAANAPVPNAPQHSIVWGVVAALYTAPNSVTLNLEGSTVLTGKVRYHHAYVPTVGDTVKCEWYGSDLIVVDKLA